MGLCGRARTHTHTHAHTKHAHTKNALACQDLIYHRMPLTHWVKALNKVDEHVCVLSHEVDARRLDFGRDSITALRGRVCGRAGAHVCVVVVACMRACVRACACVWLHMRVRTAARVCWGGAGTRARVG